MLRHDSYISSSSLTRARRRPAVLRRKAYPFQSLAAGFKNREFTPFKVTVSYDAEKLITLNSHNGQEFNYILEGKLLLNLNGKEIILHPGDSIYFDSNIPHGMKALDGENVKFLAIII